MTIKLARLCGAVDIFNDIIAELEHRAGADESLRNEDWWDARLYEASFAKQVLERYLLTSLDAIGDQVVRQALKLRFINGIEWDCVAIIVAEPDIKQLCQKYLKAKVVVCSPPLL